MDKEQGAAGEDTSPVIDDVLYCLQKSALRAMSTIMPSLATRVLDTVKGIFQKDVIDLLKHHRGNAMASTTVAMDSLVTDEWVLALNDMQVTVEYTDKLVAKLVEESELKFNTKSIRQQTSVTQAAQEIAATTKQIKKLLRQTIEKLFQIKSDCLANVFRFEELSALSFNLSDAEFAEQDANDPYAAALCQRLEECLTEARERLEPGAFDQLAIVLIRSFCARLEEEVMKKSFNQLGGLQLDKDVRCVTNLFANLCHTGIRDNFARLRLVASLLSIDKASEAHDIFGDGSDQPLTAEQVMKVLQCRKDFPESALEILTLG
eukprot:c20787_g8_i1.p1 GENE.c20787_g8_i1~~c20787_g8_i1.p1  ORF type:complete len:320 (-),score=100.26 c20787_g8_i1:124-1083(-)